MGELLEDGVEKLALKSPSSEANLLPSTFNALFSALSPDFIPTASAGVLAVHTLCRSHVHACACS